MKLRLDNRVAIVTGAGHGMGRATAIFLAEQGARVVVNDLGCEVDGSGYSASPAAEVADEINKTGGYAVPNHQSVATMDGAKDIVESALINFNRVDILVNAAAILRQDLVVDITEPDWDIQMATNLKGHFSCIKAALPHMMEQKYGRIINFSSAAAMGDPGDAAYGASKAGVLGLTRSLANEVKDYGITVNAIMPVARTRMYDFAGPGKVATDQPPERIAPLVAYLASDKAGNITGKTLAMRLKGMIQLICDPHAVQGVYKETPWTVEDIHNVMGQLLN